MDTIINVKKIAKEIEKKTNGYSLEVLCLDDNIILYSNKGNIEKIEKNLNEKLSPYKYVAKIINIATAYIVPKPA